MLRNTCSRNICFQVGGCGGFSRFERKVVQFLSNGGSSAPMSDRDSFWGHPSTFEGPDLSEEVDLLHRLEVQVEQLAGDFAGKWNSKQLISSLCCSIFGLH